MALTQYYVDPAIAADSGTGTIGDPFGDLQYALNTIVRDTVNGDQINIKAGTAELLTASLTLATYGTPTYTAPLLLRGYTAAAGDGGVGIVDGDNGNFTIWSTAYNYVSCVDMEFRNTGTASLFSLGTGILLFRCVFHGSTYSAAGSVNIVRGSLVGCHIYDVGGRAANPGGGIVHGCYISSGPTTHFVQGVYGNGISPISVQNNIIVCGTTSTVAIYVYRGSPMYVCNNILYNTAAGTSAAVDLFTSAAENECPSVINNIIVGWSGVGGTGIKNTGRPIGLLGHNAFYNVTTPESLGTVFCDLGNDVTLAADPFTDAAGGDFSLTAAARAALRDVGWPAQFPGAHANTDGHITIGPIQYGPTAGGYTPKALRFGLKGIK